MRLADWLLEKHKTDAEFADLIGVHRSTVGRWCDLVNGSRPNWGQIEKISSVTHGAVTANDFMSADPGLDDEGFAAPFNELDPPSEIKAASAAGGTA